MCLKQICKENNIYYMEPIKEKESVKVDLEKERKEV